MNKTIIIQETANIPRFGEYVRVAVPCVRGELMSSAQLAILDPAGKVQPVQVQVLKEWPDHSAKWLLSDFAATLPAGETGVYKLVVRAEQPGFTSSVRVKPGKDTWGVETGAGTFALDAQVFRPFTQVRGVDGDFLAGSSACEFKGQEETIAQPLIDEITLESAGPLHAIVRMAGHFSKPPGKGMRFSCRLHFFAGSMAVKIEFTLHNPQAARHPGGLWDLGDPGSILFKELSFAFPLGMSEVDLHCAAELGSSPFELHGKKCFTIYQESSGGTNWQSPTHRNREGRVPHNQRGYVVEIDGRQVASGERATPLIWCGNRTAGIAAALPYFWQEFPKAFKVNGEQLRIELFPARYPDLHELQGGEQKTHAVWLDFSVVKEGLAWALSPLQAFACPADYRASGVLIDLPGDDDLVDAFTSPDDLLVKRETADEYGWRHFGEVYADHEAVNPQGDGIFVSHYNNQYDFIAGAYRKAFASGNSGWNQIAAELAIHVRDIDLYHTDLDREEYNHGLFWHTDHYTDAGLSTHRAYSREQKAAYALHFGGGGPGAEHCYTTGLMLHYFQTGNPDFRQAVIALAEWELLALAGPQTLLAALKRGVGYLNLWRTCRDQRRLFPRHPLTRGTGNAITACLDAFEVGGGRKFLDRAEELIRNTLHPGDDLTCRDLLNTEISWSYTVLLAAVAKFLDKKVELAEFDVPFAHARAGLLAYAAWMAEHEYPYLEKPEILEYPNETWAAQDLRKSLIFFKTARFSASGEQQAVFEQKARFFFDYASDELAKHDKSACARPLVLMLQNGWVGSRLRSSVSKSNFESLSVQMGSPTPHLYLGSVLTRIGAELCHALGQTSVKREMAWLRARIG